MAGMFILADLTDGSRDSKLLDHQKHFMPRRTWAPQRSDWRQKFPSAGLLGQLFCQLLLLLLPVLILAMSDHSGCLFWVERSRCSPSPKRSGIEKCSDHTHRPQPLACCFILSKTPVTGGTGKLLGGQQSRKGQKAEAIHAAGFCCVDLRKDTSGQHLPRHVQCTAQFSAHQLLLWRGMLKYLLPDPLVYNPGVSRQYVETCDGKALIDGLAS